MRKGTLKNSYLSILSATLISATAFTNTVSAAQAGATGWKQEGNSWKYYSEAGVLAKGFIKLGEDWYYLDTATGDMKTGWFKAADGNWYYFNTLSDGAKGKMLTGWQWIDGYCYYFSAVKDATEGRLYTSTKTPDGYLVDADGRWIEENGSIHFVPGKGQSSQAESDKSALRTGGTRGGSSVGGGRVGSSSGGSTRGGSSRGGSSSGGSGNTGSSSNEQGSGSNKNPQNNQGNQNNQNNQNNGTDNSGSNGNVAETSLLSANFTKLVDLGWIEYAVVTFNEGTYEDYNIYVNGVEVSSAISKVDDTGKVVKWASTVVAPKNIEVERKTDGKKEKLTYTNGKTDAAPSVGSLSSAPAYILTNGPISVFDYHLSNYDENGNVRRFPSTSTFDLTNSKKINKSKNLPKANYAPDVEIDSVGNGQIVIKLSLDENSKKWFDAISEIKILDYEYKLLKTNPVYESSIETQYGTTGVIKIRLPQTNVVNRGRYFVNIASDYSADKYTVPVHLVSNVDYKLNQSTETPNPKVGAADVIFKITGPNNETFGNDLKMPVTGVDLKFPNGEVKALKNIEQYSVIGDVLHIYEKHENKDTKEVTKLITEAGIYEVTVRADGYKTMSKKFEVGASTNSVGANADIDLYSSATGSGGSIGGGSKGDGSSGGSTYNINANLLFEHELLANALVLNEIGLRNENSTKVVERFFARQNPEGVLKEDIKAVYSQSDFLNKVKDARLENNEVLTFAKYLEGSTKTITYPANIKRVLEDGNLGPVERLSESKGEDAGSVTGTTVNEGQDFELSFANPKYLENITEIYLNGNGTALRKDANLEQYKIENGKLIIKASTVKASYGQPYVGKHKLTIIATGYKKQEIELVVKRIEEVFELKLETKEPKLGNELVFKASSDDANKGSFLRNLAEIHLLDSENKERTVRPVGQEGSDIGYTVNDGKIILAKNTLTKEGEYKLVVRAQGYGQKSVSFTVAKAEDNNNAGQTATTPKYKSSTYVPKNPMFAIETAKYVVEFELEGAEADKNIIKWLGTAGIQVKVNDTVYSKALTTVQEGEYYIGQSANSAYGGAYKYLHLSASAFRDGDNNVEISVPGYDTLSFTIKKETAGNNTNPSTPDKGGTSSSTNGAREFKFKNSVFEKGGNGYFSEPDKYVIEFEPRTADAEADKAADPVAVWLGGARDKKANKSHTIEVSVNGQKIEKSLTSLENGRYKVGQKNRVEGGPNKYLHIAASVFRDGDNTVVVSSSSGSTLTFNLTKGSGSSSQTQPSNPGSEGEQKEVPAYKATGKQESNYSGKGLKIEYNASDRAVVDFLSKLVKTNSSDVKAKVSVNGVEYEYVSRGDYPYRYTGNVYTLGTDGNGRDDKIVFGNTVNATGNTVISIKAEGYKEFTITLDNTGKVVTNAASSEDEEGEDASLADAPKVQNVKDNGFFTRGVVIQLNSGTAGEFFKALKEGAEVTVNQTAYTLLSGVTEYRYSANKNVFIIGNNGYGSPESLILNYEAFVNGENTVTVKVNNYKTLTVKINKTNSAVTLIK